MVGKEGSDATPSGLNRFRPNGDLGYGVGRVVRRFQVNEDRGVVPFVIQLAQELAHEAGLAHAPLCGQERVGAVLDALPEFLEFSLAVEEAVAVDPVGACFYQLDGHGSTVACQQDCWQQVCWGIVARMGAALGGEARGAAGWGRMAGR